MAKLKVVVVVLVFLGCLALGTGLIAQQNTGDGADPTKGFTPMNPTIKALIEARLEAAKQVYETMMQPTRDGSMDDLTAWSRRWMDEQINLDPSPTKKLAAIQEHLNRTRVLEEMADARHKAARGSHAEILKVKYFRLEAEQMLAELRIINPVLFPTKPAPKG